MRVKEESEKADLKLNIQKMNIMVSGPITHAKRWRKSGSSTDFIFFGSKVTGDSDCSHKIKRRLLLRKKAMTNLDSILKSRDFALPTKIHIVKSVVFLVVI